MDPSGGNTGGADVQNLAMEATERAFARTTKLGQTEDVTNCSGGMETGVNAKGNRAESNLPLEETVGAKV